MRFTSQLLLTAAHFFGGRCDEVALSLLQTQVSKHQHKAPTEEGPRAESPPGSLRADYDAQEQDSKEYSNLKFTKVAYRNLGGLGPNTGVPENIRYINVARDFEGNNVDMILSSTNYVSAKPRKSGLYGDLAVVNILNGNEVDFTASFVNKDDKPVSLGKFHISFSDLDTGKEAGEEELTIGGFLSSYTIDNTELTQVKMADGRTKFIAGEPGVGADNPKDPLMLTDVQAARTVSFVFPAGLDSFKFTYKVHKNADGSTTEGRHFLISGMTSMYFCNANPISMDFDLATVGYSNLGGMGPDFNSPKALRFNNIASIENDQAVDMTVQNLTEYVPANTTNNGLNGQFAQVNIGGGSMTRFRFSFLKGGTDEPLNMDWTYLSIYDLDQGKKNEWYQESLEVKGFATHYLTESSELQLTQIGDKWYEYRSSTYGTGKDNPTDPMALTEQQKNRAVTFLFHNVKTFDARFEADKPAKSGRNFLFAGKSSVVFC